MVFVRLERNTVPQPIFNTQNNTSLLPLKMVLNAWFYLLHLTRLYQSTQYFCTELLPQINRVYLYQEPCCNSAQILSLIFYSIPPLIPASFCLLPLNKSMLKLLPYNLTSCLHFAQAASDLASG